MARRGLTDFASMPGGFEAFGLSLEGGGWQKLGSLGLTIFAAVLKQLGSVAAAVSAKIWDEAFTMFLSVGLLDRSSLGFVGGAIHSERQF
jgi:hypothetical protein